MQCFPCSPQGWPRLIERGGVLSYFMKYEVYRACQVLKYLITMKAVDRTYVAKSKIHGRGLFAAVDIPKGTFIGMYGDKIVPRTPRNIFNKHGLQIEREDGSWVIVLGGQSKLRFINHSRKQNVDCFRLRDFRATKNIKQDEEILWNYGRDSEAYHQDTQKY